MENPISQALSGRMTRTGLLSGKERGLPWRGYGVREPVIKALLPFSPKGTTSLMVMVSVQLLRNTSAAMKSRMRAPSWCECCLRPTRIYHNEAAAGETGRDIIRLTVYPVKPEAEERSRRIKVYHGAVIKYKRDCLRLHVSLDNSEVFKRLTRSRKEQDEKIRGKTETLTYAYEFNHDIELTASAVSAI
ncbi:MAG: hypothetical protein MZV63_23310 [Marinilabiliales bacterium]|nr:hypothetical protein [Marinilabiliales bacterium]